MDTTIIQYRSQHSVGTVDSRSSGSFFEYMGRAVYDMEEPFE